jgi:hypothetical protein
MYGTIPGGYRRKRCLDCCFDLPPRATQRLQTGVQPAHANIISLYALKTSDLAPSASEAAGHWFESSRAYHSSGRCCHRGAVRGVSRHGTGKRCNGPGNGVVLVGNARLFHACTAVAAIPRFEVRVRSSRTAYRCWSYSFRRHAGAKPATTTTAIRTTCIQCPRH